MLGIISLAVYSTFNNGFKVWQKINQSVGQDDLGLFFDKLSQDLNSCVKIGNIPFSGDQNNLGIPTLVNSPRLKIRTAGLVNYLYDQQSGVLNRQTKDFSQLYSHQDYDSTAILKNLRSFKFEYYYFDKQKQEYFWKEVWSETGIPLAVRVNLNLNDSSGTDTIIRTTTIHVGG